MTSVGPGWWGSDAVVGALVAAGVDLVALNPGSSFRGLHDSLVNPPTGRAPELLLCLHEEHAVAIAHGYAKVTGRPIGVVLHSNVGLMHATMALYNAYCDRVPMVVLGAQGPAAAERRRPWIDWIHTSADLGALVRGYVKWDDAPASVSASSAAVLRASQLTRSAPHAPTYVCLDVSVQEESLPGPPPAPDAARAAPFPDPGPPTESVRRAASALVDAERVVVLAGRVSRDAGDWDRRIALAERLGADVITSQRAGAAFPTSHPRHLDTLTGLGLTPAAARALRDADVVLALEWVDLGGTLASAAGDDRPAATVIAASMEHQLLSGWAKLDFAPAPIDLVVPAPPDSVVAALVDRLPPDGVTPRARPSTHPDPPLRPTRCADGGSALTMPDLQAALREATMGSSPSLLRVPFSWDPRGWPVEDPLDLLGGDGGGGIGSGPGMCVGGALALRGSGRLPVGVLGDGDLLMGVTALWTAAHHDVSLLVVVANNRSYLNDERHQEAVARERGRPVDRAHLGIAIRDPAPDLAGLARAQGWLGYGPVLDREQLRASMAQAVAKVRAGGRALLDVVVEPG